MSYLKDVIASQNYNSQEQEFILAMEGRLLSSIDDRWNWIPWLVTLNYANVIKNYNNCWIRRSGGHGRYFITSSFAYGIIYMTIKHNGRTLPKSIYFENSNYVSEEELIQRLKTCFTNGDRIINYEAVWFFVHRFTQRMNKN
jgi:hypothetical protein